MKVQLKITTQMGEFIGYPFEIDQDQYKTLKEKTSRYYEEGGFEMITEDGNFIIISPEVVKTSILKINVVKDVQE